MTLREKITDAIQSVPFDAYGMACSVPTEEAGEMADAILLILKAPRAAS